MFTDLLQPSQPFCPKYHRGIRLADEDAGRQILGSSSDHGAGKWQGVQAPTVQLLPVSSPAVSWGESGSCHYRSLSGAGKFQEDEASLHFGQIVKNVLNQP